VGHVAGVRKRPFSWLKARAKTKRFPYVGGPASSHSLAALGIPAFGSSGIALCGSSGEAMKRTDARRKRRAGVASAIENRRIGQDWPYWALRRWRPNFVYDCF
jgi:hypothetical protein